ncbi:TPA: sigma-70 family RNA polymerase sigma factor [Candidatus Poribacteria bacterium]|nr:sigma-70 family RNA polymerase sigma factor [Candidatus Poribacteria bacterium]
MEDRRLIEGLLNNDITAFNEIISRAVRMAMACYKRFRQDLKTLGLEPGDVAQEVLLRLVNSDYGIFRRWDYRESVDAAIYKITRNLCLDLAKKARRERRMIKSYAEIRSEAQTNDFQLEREEVQRSFERCLNSLSEVDRRIIQMRRAGKSFDEIAKAVDASYSMVTTRFHRAKRRLKNMLRELGIGYHDLV